ALYGAVAAGGGPPGGAAGGRAVGGRDDGNPGPGGIKPAPAALGRGEEQAAGTGEAGFLRPALLARLAARRVGRRAPVRCARAPVRSASAPCEAEARCVGDLRDDEAVGRAVDGVDWVVHAGARVSTTGAWEEFDATNVRATDVLIQRASAAGVGRVVHVSSLS